MKIHSIAFRLTSLMAVIITALVSILIVIDNTLAESYYYNMKKSQMIKAYETINELNNCCSNDQIDSSTLTSKLDILTSNMSMSVIVVNSDWTTIYTNRNGESDMIFRLKMSMLNNDVFENNKPDNSDNNANDSQDNDSNNSKNSDNSAQNNDSLKGQKNRNNPNNQNPPDGSNSQDQNMSYNMNEGKFEDRTIIESNDNYTLQKIYDSKFSSDYLELWGTLDNGSSVMMRMSFDEIKESVKIFNKFATIVGIVLFMIGIIASIITSRYMTKPIKQLSKLSQEMSNLNFDIKYKGDDKDEIGDLGNSMNKLSDKLEKTISELKSANTELMRDIENRDKAEQMRTDFLSNVTHELKTPIALIQGYAEGLKDGISDDPESMDYYCDVIIDESAKMNNMVKKLLTLNQIEFGNEEIVMSRFDIVDLVSNVVNANQLRAQNKGISLLFNHDKTHCDVWSDEYKIEEVLTNYVTNAINHCDFDKKIIINLQELSDRVRISVFNTGKQIPEEDLENIWIKFYKVDKARTREYGGNGIGLSIVKAIMEKYGKGYGVNNVDGGVEFYLELDSKA